MKEVRQVRISDQGSNPQHAKVELQGVSGVGVIDSSADITIVGGDLFRRVAAAARLKKKNFKKPDKVPKTYDRRTFALDGRMDLDVSFDVITMNTPVYIKLDAPEQLLLLEGVCRQLGIISYHSDILVNQKTNKSHWQKVVKEEVARAADRKGHQTKSREEPGKADGTTGQSTRSEKSKRVGSKKQVKETTRNRDGENRKHGPCAEDCVQEKSIYPRRPKG